MCAHVHMCRFVCLFVIVCACVEICVSVSVSLSVCLFVCVCLCMSVCLSVCLCPYVYVFVCVLLYKLKFILDVRTVVHYAFQPSKDNTINVLACMNVQYIHMYCTYGDGIWWTPSLGIATFVQKNYERGQVSRQIG